MPCLQMCLLETVRHGLSLQGVASREICNSSKMWSWGIYNKVGGVSAWGIECSYIEEKYIFELKLEGIFRRKGILGKKNSICKKSMG